MLAAPEFLVDFVIGGTQKGGTSALAYFLGRNPDICLPVNKEAHLFDAPDFPEDGRPEEVSRRYRRAFPAELRGRIIGDATPIYMYLPCVPPRIKAYNPAMKWILLLRNPIERALSHYSMERARKAERLPVEIALRVEGFRLLRGRGRSDWNSALRTHSYLDRGFYSRQLEHLWKYFPREQTLVLTSEQLREEHMETLARVHAFLGADTPEPPPPAETIFAAETKATICPATRAWLRRRFAPEIARLEKLTGLRLDRWK